MKPTPIWRSIVDDLTHSIASGAYPPGHRLPTEAELATRFGVNRHTVRRALAHMVDEGLIHTRRGSGAFVLAQATEYPIGRRVRFHQNLKAAGHIPDKRWLTIETRVASPEEARALKLKCGALVHVCDGLSLSDDHPIAVVRSIFPAEGMMGLPQALEEEKSVTKALKRMGVSDFTRQSTRLSARSATATQALHLKLREGAPVLYSVGVNVDGSGKPVEYGQTWFSGENVTLTLTEFDM